MKWAMTAASIGSVLARLPNALAKARTWAGLTTTTGRPAADRLAGDDRLVAAGRFEAHDRHPKLAEPVLQLLEPRLGARDHEPFARWANPNVQFVLGDVDSDNDRVHPIPSLRKRARLAAQATVRVRWNGGRRPSLLHGLVVPKGARSLVRHRPSIASGLIQVTRGAGRNPSPEMPEPRPRLLRRLERVAAEPERLAGFVRHGQRIVEPADRLDRAEHLEEPLPRPAEDQNDAAVGAARTPQIVVLVRADRGWEAPARAEIIDGRGVAVVPGEEDGARAVIRRQRLIGLTDRRRHLRPAEHVGVILRQRGEPQPFAGAGPEADRPLIGDEGVDRQNRNE